MFSKPAELSATDIGGYSASDFCGCAHTRQVRIGLPRSLGNEGLPRDQVKQNRGSLPPMTVKRALCFSNINNIFSDDAKPPDALQS